MTEIPAAIRDVARAAFAGRPADIEGQFALDSRRNPWTALDDALTASIPAALAAERARLADRLHSIAERSLGEYRDGMLAAAELVAGDGQEGAQPATPAAPDTETTRGTEGGTDELSALRDRIAAALTAEHYRRAREQIIASPEEHQAGCADVVMDVIRPHLDQAFCATTQEVPDALCNEVARAIRQTVRVNPGPDLRKQLAANDNSTLVLSAGEADEAARVALDVLARRYSCDGDPIECAHEAARGQAEAELAKTREVLDFVSAADLRHQFQRDRARQRAEQYRTAWWSARIRAANMAAIMERFPDVHMRFRVLGEPGDLPCADWCYACKLDAATKRAEQAEAAIAKHRDYLDRTFRQWCSPYGVAADYATKLIAQLDTALAPDPEPTPLNPANGDPS